jgi:hypothetical protein
MPPASPKPSPVTADDGRREPTIELSARARRRASVRRLDRVRAPPRWRPAGDPPRGNPQFPLSDECGRPLRFLPGSCRTTFGLWRGDQPPRHSVSCAGARARPAVPDPSKRSSQVLSAALQPGGLSPVVCGRVGSRRRKCPQNPGRWQARSPCDGVSRYSSCPGGQSRTLCLSGIASADRRDPKAINGSARRRSVTLLLGGVPDPAIRSLFSPEACLKLQRRYSPRRRATSTASRRRAASISSSPRA